MIAFGNQGVSIQMLDNKMGNIQLAVTKFFIWANGHETDGDELIDEIDVIRQETAFGVYPNSKVRDITVALCHATLLIHELSENSDETL